MSRITNITGAAWPTSGTPTGGPGNTGLSAIGASGTFVVSGTLPPGSVSASVIQWAAGAAGSFKVDADGTAFADDTNYWLKFWLRPVRSGTLAADGTNGRILSIAQVSTRFTLEAYVRNNGLSDGFNLLGTSYLSGAIATRIAGVGAASSAAIMPFDAWSEITIQYLFTTPGEINVYLNGVMIYRSTGGDVAGVITSLSSLLSVSLPAYSGIQWQLCGPIESWKSTDIPVRPVYGLVAETDLTSKTLLHGPWLNRAQGGLWKSSGTATITPTAPYSGGGSTWKYRSVVSGTAQQTATLTSIDDIGVLPYNEAGWATVLFPWNYLPSGATCSWQLNSASNASSLVTLTCDGTNLLQGATVLAPWDATHRYALAIHLNSSGEAAFTLFDQTADFRVARQVWSGALAAWVPSSVGELVQSSVLGSASLELGGASVHRWFDVVGVDSLSGAATTSITPSYFITNHVTLYLWAGNEYLQIPGGAYPGRQSAWPWSANAVVAGRPGGRRSQWSANVLPYLSGSRGIRVVFVDGGAINDVAVLTDSLAGVQAIVANILADVAQITAAGNRVLLTTMIRREQGTYTAVQLAAIGRINAEIYRIAAEFQTDGLVAIADVASQITPNHLAMFSAGDDTHFNTAGDTLYATDIVSSLTTPGTSTLPPDSTVSDAAIADAVWAYAGPEGRRLQS